MTDIVRETNSYIYNVWRTYIIGPVVHIMTYIMYIVMYVSYIDGVSSIVNPTSIQDSLEMMLYVSRFC